MGEGTRHVPPMTNADAMELSAQKKADDDALLKKKTFGGGSKWEKIRGSVKGMAKRMKAQKEKQQAHRDGGPPGDAGPPGEEEEEGKAAGSGGINKALVLRPPDQHDKLVATFPSWEYYCALLVYQEIVQLCAEVYVSPVAPTWARAVAVLLFAAFIIPFQLYVVWFLATKTRGKKAIVAQASTDDGDGGTARTWIDKEDASSTDAFRDRRDKGRFWNGSVDRHAMLFSFFKARACCGGAPPAAAFVMFQRLAIGVIAGALGSEEQRQTQTAALFAVFLSWLVYVAACRPYVESGSNRDDAFMTFCVVGALGVNFWTFAPNNTLLAITLDGGDVGLAMVGFFLAGLAMLTLRFVASQAKPVAVPRHT